MDNTALSDIFMAQYNGPSLSLFDGTNWQQATPASEVLIAVSGFCQIVEKP